MGLQIQAFESKFLSGVLNVLAQSMSADPISRARFTQQVLLDPNFRAEGAAVALRDGDVVGFCLGMKRYMPLENAPPDYDRGYITLLGVLHKYRRQSIGAQLLAHVEGYFEAQNCTLVMVSSYAPGYFTPGVDVEAYSSGLQFFAHKGYGEVYRPMAMQTSLWGWDRPEWVEEKKTRLAAEGVEIKPYDSELTLALLEFASVEFQGDWVRFVRETMGRILQGESPTRIICAVEDEKIIGFAHFDKERFGPIGVAATERGRGLGQVLMWETLRAQREQGLRASWFLWSDDETAARIYTGAGFREVRRFALLKKSLAKKEATA